MVIPAAAARDVLHGRLAAVFDPGAFGSLYPGVKAPRVELGFPVNEPPFYVAVDEIAETASTGGSASMGHAEVSFDLQVWLCASHKELKTAADAVLAYADAVFAAVLADPQLNLTVDNALPSIRNAGTGADSSKRYVAAASVAVACTVGSCCPAEIKEIVDAANRKD